MSDKTLTRQTYLTRNIGDFAARFEFQGLTYEKVEDLRYGTNPHQPAAFYRPVGAACPIGDMEVLKTGKSGLSQTNLEDISYALNILKYFAVPACAVMKHVNPSGVAVRFRDNETLKDVYIKARDCDARAAFGSVVAFNAEVDAATAMEIMSGFVECVVAPAFAPAALTVFNDQETYKVNKHIRILRCGDLSLLPKFVDETAKAVPTVKVLADGSLVLAAPLLTHVRNAEDLTVAEAESKTGVVRSEVPVTADQRRDLLTAWYVNISVRSNGVVIVRNGQTLSVGTGEQDRVGAVEQAIQKYKEKYKGENSLDGAVMSSDGFFPFPDAVEVAAKAGIKAVVSPGGSLRDAEVIARANALGVASLRAPERVFSHH